MQRRFPRRAAGLRLKASLAAYSRSRDAPPGSFRGLHRPLPVTPKNPSASRTRMNELVLPNDTNTLGNLMGGRLLHFMDVAGGIAAMRHSNRTCVTASVDNVDFKSAISLGEVVLIEAVVNRAFTTSMEVEIDVWAEDTATGTRRKCNRAFYTFVAVDQSGRPIPIPGVEPETDEEHERYDGAGRRRELRLILSGRLNLADATDLREHLAAATATAPDA